MAATAAPASAAATPAAVARREAPRRLRRARDVAFRPTTARARWRVRADALAQARQAPQAAPRPARRRLARTGEGPVRRVRTQGARGRLAQQPADRGRAYRDDTQDQ